MNPNDTVTGNTPVSQVSNTLQVGTNPASRIKNILLLMLLLISIVMNLGFGYLVYTRNFPLFITESVRTKTITRNDDILVPPVSFKNPYVKTVAFVYSYSPLTIKQVNTETLQVENALGLREFKFLKDTAIFKQIKDELVPGKIADLAPGQQVEVLDAYIYNKGWYLQQVRIIEGPNNAPVTFK